MTKGEKDATSGGGLVPGLLSGMVTTARQMLAPVRTAFARHQIGRGHRPSPAIVLAELGDDAGVVGAAHRARTVLAERTGGAA